MAGSDFGRDDWALVWNKAAGFSLLVPEEVDIRAYPVKGAAMIGIFKLLESKEFIEECAKPFLATLDAGK